MAWRPSEIERMELEKLCFILGISFGQEALALCTSILKQNVSYRKGLYLVILLSTEYTIRQ